MAITQAFCTSAKAGFLRGDYIPTSNTMKIALYTSAATLDATTSVYSATNEVSGTGYTAGGNTLTGAVIGSGSGTAWITFADSTWTTATITARGALIYDSSVSNAAIAVLDFGSDKISTAGTFTVQMPAAVAATALIRIA